MVNEKLEELYTLIKEFPKVENRKEKKNDNNYIKKETIKKDNLIINLYMFSFTHTSLTELDDNYEPVPLKNEELFEYGAIASIPFENGYYDVVGLFGGIENNKDSAYKNYNELKSKISSLSEEEIIEKIKIEILNQKDAKND